MGRARNHQRRTVTAGNFNTILGVHRGSVAAQAQRDVEDDAQRKEAFAQFRLLVGNEIPVFAANHSTYLLAKILISKYCEGAPASEVAEEILELAQTAPTSLDSKRLVENFALIVANGDPLLCPGLTEPALLALCRCFAKDSKFVFDDGSGKEDERGARNFVAGRVIRILFGDGEDEAFYVRTQQLCENIGRRIARSVVVEGWRDELLGECAARALLMAPEAALAGPLRSWVNAFAQRSEQGSLTGIERRLLGALVFKYESGSVGADALAGLGLRSM
jgi:hypothetical protein